MVYAEVVLKILKDYYYILPLVWSYHILND